MPNGEEMLQQQKKVPCSEGDDMKTAIHYDLVLGDVTSPVEVENQEDIENETTNTPAANATYAAIEAFYLFR
jgi:hypothetical protein